MKTMTFLRSHIVIASAVAASCLIGCHVGPTYQRPPAVAQAPPAIYKESPQNFPDSDAWKVAQPQDAMLRGKWWEIYNDPELNALEDKVDIDNQNIKSAFQNFMAARAVVAEARSQLFPVIGFNPSFQENGTSANNSTTNSNSSNPTVVVPTSRVSGNYSLPFDVSWEPDLWGRIRNTIREQQYAAQVSEADLENERLTEQASLAIFFFQLRGQDALLALLNQTIADFQKTLDYTRAQYETGVGTQISVVEAQNSLQNAQASATNVGVARAQYEHAIAVLIGANPSTFSVPVRPLNATPPAIPLGMPSQLLERRPDIAAAERTMAQANAAIGVADAAFFPTLTLGATAGLSSSSFKHLFEWSSRVWSVGPSVSETIYDGGLRRATVHQFTAIYNADVANYRQTVLTSFQQIEDYLAAVRILSQQIQQQQQAVASAQQFVDLELARYQTGIDPYIDLITAQNTLLSDQQTITGLHTQAMTASVQLIVALGGGWDSSQLPSPAQVSQKPTAAQTAIQR
ncbi:MAG TPA: efflux transporter outer membrane subunit [Acidobacteriaceae bacterium]|jgi:NodT family efflux transporter outer membrane factor (OMF) lipoprotein|nr:efflux transporter outer membrane subunit [Acidobacteriaceae bacterium]